MLMPLDQRLDWPRYGGAVLGLLIAAAAARFSAERDGLAALGGWLFWCLVFLLCWLLRPTLHRGGDSKLPERAGNLVAGLSLFGFLFKLAVSGLLPALAFLLLAGQAALLLLAEKRQHLWLLLAAALAAVLFAAAESRSPLFLPCAAWFAFAALGLVSVDRAQLQEQRALAQPSAARGRSAGGALFAALSLLLALPLYLFLPKPEGLELGGMSAQSAHDYGRSDVRGDAYASDGLQGDGGEAMAAGGGEGGGAEGQPQALSPDDLDIRQPPRPQRALANDILMFVDSSQPLNLRSNLLDHFDKDRWSRQSATAARRPLQRGYYEVPGFDPEAPVIQQRIELVADLDARLPLAPGLRRLRFPAGELDEYADGSWRTLRPLRAPTQYSVESAPELRGGRYLLREAPPADPAPYLQLPQDLSPRIRELATAVAGSGDPLHQALALEQHLRSQYQYSFDTVITSQGVTPLDDFLFHTRRGHCEYFASALAVMLRSVGIASRLAQGFSLGARNPITGYYEVRRLQGHAWVEAYLPDYGWMMFEPTPFYPLPSPVEDAQVAAELERYLDQLARNAETLEPETLKAQLLGAARDSWKQLRHLLRQAATALAGPLRWWPALAVAAALLLLGGHLARLWLRDARDNRCVRALLARGAAGAPGPHIVAVAEALQAALAERGTPRAPGTPFAPYYQALQAAGSPLPAGFDDCFNAARYAGEQADAATTDDVAARVRRLLVEQPRPRLSRQLAAWRQGWRRLGVGRFPAGFRGNGG